MCSVIWHLLCKNKCTSLKHCCRVTIRLWLELVIEHLVRGCGWPRENRHLYSPGDQKEWVQSEAIQGSCRALQTLKEWLLGPRLLLGKECCIARDPLCHLSELNSSSCICFTWYFQEPVRSSFASLWVEQLLFTYGGILSRQIIIFIQDINTKGISHKWECHKIL